MVNKFENIYKDPYNEITLLLKMLDDDTCS